MARQIRVVIADDEAPYRSALQKALSMVPDCELIAACKDGREALEVCLADPPDVLLSDMNMPHMNGQDLIKKLLQREPDVKVVLLTVSEDDDSIMEAFRAGATSYLLKTSTAQDVVAAIRCAARGEALITPKVATRLIEELRKTNAPPLDSEDNDLLALSEREAQILDLVAEGMRNREIAKKLAIAEKTVKNHVSNILKALQVSSRTEAAMKAVKARRSGDLD